MPNIKNASQVSPAEVPNSISISGLWKRFSDFIEHIGPAPEFFDAFPNYAHSMNIEEKPSSAGLEKMKEAMAPVKNAASEYQTKLMTSVSSSGQSITKSGESLSKAASSVGLFSPKESESTTAQDNQVIEVVARRFS